MKEKQVKSFGEIVRLAWELLYPLLGYQLIVAAVIAASAAFFELENQELLLTAVGAALASVPLGMEYRKMRSSEASLPGLGSVFNRPDFARSERKRRLPLRVNQAVRLAFLGAAMCVAGNSLMLLVGKIALPNDFAAQAARLYAPPVAVQVACMGVVIPWTEELIFRGLGYGRLRRHLSVPAAAIVSAVYFGAYHGNLTQAIYAGLLGLALAFCYEIYDSLIAPYLVHAAANLASIALSVSWVGAWLAESVWVQAGSMIGFGGFTAYLLYRSREDGK